MSADDTPIYWALLATWDRTQPFPFPLPEPAPIVRPYVLWFTRPVTP